MGNHPSYTHTHTAAVTSIADVSVILSAYNSLSAENDYCEPQICLLENLYEHNAIIKKKEDVLGVSKVNRAGVIIIDKSKN